MLNSTIFSEEFHRKLQDGEVQEALVLLLTNATKLNVTTQMTDENSAEFPKSVYLRTKIDLLTGEVYNEVGKDLVVKSSNYIKLQQLHIEQIISSHQIIEGYLQQIQEIIAASQPESILETDSTIDRVNLSDSLPTRLSETFRAILTSSPLNISEDLDKCSIITEIVEPLDRSTKSSAIFDDEMDLSLDENTVVWEEWIEEDEIESIPKIEEPEPSYAGDNSSDWKVQQLSPLTIKPSVARVVDSSTVDSGEHWDKFSPEHIGIYIDPKSNLPINSDPHQVDRLLADLDQINKNK